jgi:5-deoxy-5-amino-3-dehydroquinate synthase
MIVTIELTDRSYDVVLAEGARNDLAALVRRRAPHAQAAAIITSASLRERDWFDIDAGVTQCVIEVPEGEAAKTFSTIESVCEQLAAHGLSRQDVVIGVGGGAITDLAGFAAAVYLRGVGVIQVPTSLVAQVDAAIGGKTAVNLTSGKNLVGAFHQPLGVLCDFETLATLPERERLGGLGEVAKCWLLEGRDVNELARCSLSDLVTMSVELKAAIVTVDEFEGGQRALLNYGHTLGHALELSALARDADELRHGEAVAIGLAFAARLAHALGRVDASEIGRHDEVLATLGLAGRVPADLDSGELVDAMTRDKKAHHDLAFVLAGPNGFEVVRGVDPAVVAQVLERFRGEQ